MPEAARMMASAVIWIVRAWPASAGDGHAKNAQTLALAGDRHAKHAQTLASAGDGHAKNAQALAIAANTPQSKSFVQLI